MAYPHVHVISTTLPNPAPRARVPIALPDTPRSMRSTPRVLVLLAALLASGIACSDDDGSGPGFLQTNLVSSATDQAPVIDPNLVNAWGIDRSPRGVWIVANNGTGTATAYDGDGTPSPPDRPTLITIPSGGAAPDALGTPTGVVANPTAGFVIDGDGLAAPADFLFATADGTIAAWSELVSPDTAVTVVDNSAAAARYTGIALGSDPIAGPFLYGANFTAATVDVFDATFAPVSIAGGFVDTRLPNGYAPFGVQNVAGNIYVAYARQNRDRNGVVAGAGNGFVSVFDVDGTFVRRFTSQGQLNAPWGIAQTPASFGRFGGAIAISNAGDGHVNAFDPVSGRFLGQLQRPNGNAITIRGLFGIGFGNGSLAGSVQTLYFAAGINSGTNGLFGSIAPS